MYGKPRESLKTIPALRLVEAEANRDQGEAHVLTSGSLTPRHP